MRTKKSTTTANKASAATARMRAFWLCPTLFILLSLSLLLSFAFGAEITGHYGKQFYNYMMSNIGRSASLVGAVGLLLCSIRSLGGRSMVKPYVSWGSFIMGLMAISVLEAQLMGTQTQVEPLSGGFFGSYVANELRHAFGLVGHIIMLAILALSIVAWGGESAETFVFDWSQKIRTQTQGWVNAVVEHAKKRAEERQAAKAVAVAVAEATAVAEAQQQVEDDYGVEPESIPEPPKKKPSRKSKKAEQADVIVEEPKVTEVKEESQFKNKPVDIEAMVKQALEDKMKANTERKEKSKAKKERASKTEEETVALEVTQEDMPDVTPIPSESVGDESATNLSGTEEEGDGHTLSNKPAAQLSMKALKKKKKKKPKPPQVASKPGEYALPSLDLLQAVEEEDETNVEELKEINERAQSLQMALKNFGLDVQVVGIQQGPVITQYELELAPGIKVARVMNLQNDIAMALRARSVRILAPIPGKATVGVEVPNKNRKSVALRELIETGFDETKKMALPSFIGRDIFGEPVSYDVAAMPHLLMAGATGAGKSVGINCMILSILLTRSPDECKLVLVDPKQVELSFYRGIPHLISPVVTDMKKVPSILDWAVRKMEERYDLLARVGVRDIYSFNKLGEEKIKENLGITKEDPVAVDTYMPRIVIIIDELADLMMLSTSSKDVEANIQRLAQKSRAVGIHVVLATQRPSVDVITGVIKANLPCRIAYMVNSATDSRTILDRKGAEALLGRGDLLFKDPSRSDMQRLQGAFVTEDEVRDVVNYWKKQGEPNYIDDLVNSHKVTEDSANKDELYDKAVKLVLESGRGSTTFLQRMMGVGYTRASRLIETMEMEGLVGPHRGSVSREVMYTWEEYEAQLNAMDDEEEYEDDDAEYEEGDDNGDTATCDTTEDIGEETPPIEG